MKTNEACKKLQGKSFENVPTPLGYKFPFPCFENVLQSSINVEDSFLPSLSLCVKSLKLEINFSTCEI